VEDALCAFPPYRFIQKLVIVGVSMRRNALALFRPTM
jgi:hypothetical protein